MAAEALVDPGNSTAPIPRCKQDTFCEECDRNLFGEPIAHDDRLDLPILRCPACGHAHAVWRNPPLFTAVRRVMMMLIWAFCISVGVLAFINLMAALIAAEWQLLEELYLSDSTELRVIGSFTEYAVPTVIDAGLLGLLISAASLHWRRRAWLTVVLPATISMLLYFVWSGPYWRPREFAGIFAGTILVDMAAWALGLLLGKLFFRAAEHLRRAVARKMGFI